MQVRIDRVFMGYTVTPPIRVQRDTGIKDFFFQENAIFEAANILRLTPRNVKDLENGWSVTKRKIDEWEFYHGIVGYCSD